MVSYLPMSSDTSHRSGCTVIRTETMVVDCVLLDSVHDKLAVLFLLLLRVQLVAAGYIIG